MHCSQPQLCVSNPHVHAGMNWQVKMRELGVSTHPDYKLTCMLDHKAMITVQTEKYGECPTRAIVAAAHPGRQRSRLSLNQTSDRACNCRRVRLQATGFPVGQVSGGVWPAQHHHVRRSAKELRHEQAEWVSTVPTTSQGNASSYLWMQHPVKAPTSNAHGLLLDVAGW
jgi:hypothetical protein